MEWRVCSPWEVMPRKAWGWDDARMASTATLTLHHKQQMARQPRFRRDVESREERTIRRYRS